MPNAFQARMRASFAPVRVARIASGIARTPTTMSPHPADCGNGPPSRPSPASARMKTPSRRNTFTPIASETGIASIADLTAGNAAANAAVATRGAPAKSPRLLGAPSFPAAAIAIAIPAHVPPAPATIKRARRNRNRTNNGAQHPHRHSDQDRSDVVEHIFLLQIQRVEYTCSYIYLFQNGSLAASVRGRIVVSQES